VKVIVNDEDVEVDDGTTVAALLERLGFGPKGHCGRCRLVGAAALGVELGPARRCAGRGRDGGAGWVTRCS
jgi:hypothetical protein